VSGNVIRVATLNSLKQEKDEALATEQAKIKVEPLRTVLIPISFATAQALAPQGKDFLTTRGSITVDQRTNTIVVKDIEKVVSRLQKLYTALDTAPPRVAISARFVEMTKRFEKTINSILTLNANTSGLNIAANSNFGGTGATLQLTAAQFANLAAKFDLSEGEGLVRTLANPSVTVVANQKASVNQSFSFFVPGADQTAVGVLAVPTLKQITTNLQLDVTPIVAGDGSIFMNLAIKNEIPDPKGAQTTIDGRNVTTQVLIDNGDTAVVGGIFSNTYTKSDSGFPILRSIPVLGTLFTSSTENITRSEIFIFITAKITNAEDSFRRNL
jgi:type IV pilus assembly protein PilQ